MRPIKTLLTVFAALALGACSHQMKSDVPDDQCRADMGDDTKNAARVAGQGVEAGVETGVAGIKQAGRATGGLLTDGRKGAREEWEIGKAETKQEAREGEQEIAAANKPRCPTR